MFAPVETTQSTNPAFRSGTRHDTPSPAGVSAPVSDSPTVTSGFSIRSERSRAPSRSLPALYARNLLSISPEARILFPTGGGRIRAPDRYRDLLAILATPSRAFFHGRSVTGRRTSPRSD